MKKSFGLFLMTILLTGSIAHASVKAVEQIDQGLAIVQTELNAIDSGGYTGYKPATVRGLLLKVMGYSLYALKFADNEETKTVLHDLADSANEEYNYSFRFQHYRLDSTRLLMVNYQRLFELAKDSETGNASGQYDPCQDPSSRMECGN